MAQVLRPDSGGQPFVVDDRPGGGSVIGTDAVAKSPPDGYTLLMASGSITINPNLYKNMPRSSQALQEFPKIGLGNFANPSTRKILSHSRNSLLAVGADLHNLLLPRKFGRRPHSLQSTFVDQAEP